MWWHDPPPICWQWSRVRLCVRVCVKGGQGWQVGRWWVFVCVGWLRLCVCVQCVDGVRVYMCAQVVSVYVWPWCWCYHVANGRGGWVGVWVCVGVCGQCVFVLCVVGGVWGRGKRIGKRIGIGAKNESKTDSQTIKKARISAVLIKSLDNPFNLSHNSSEQEQKTKDKTNEKLFLYLDFIFCYHVARVYSRKPPRVFNKPLRTRNRIGARYGRGHMQ